MFGDVVILEVEQLHAGVPEWQVVAFPELLDQVVLDDPVDLTIELQRIVLDGLDAVLPHLQRPLLERWEPLGIGIAERTVEILALDVESADLAAVREPDGTAARGVVADLTYRTDRVLERHVAEHHLWIFEHAEHARRGTHLHERCVLAHVRVADDDVQAPILLGVGVRLVTRVDDRATPRRCR